MSIVGIDPSLTRTAIAWFDERGVTVRSLPTKGAKTDTYADRAVRINKIINWVSEVLTEEAGDVELTVIEGPSMGRSGASGSTHDRSGLWWGIYEVVGACGFGHSAVVPPTLRAKYATGKGNAGKDEVLLAVAKRWPDWCQVENNDEADALVLASMGAARIGRPILDLPATHTAALAKVAWPEPLP